MRQKWPVYLGGYWMISTILLVAAGFTYPALMPATPGKPAPQARTLGNALPEVQAKWSDSFVDSIGLNIHSDEAGTYGYTPEITTLPKVTALGVRHIRETMFPSQSPYVYYRTRLAAFSAAGLRFLLIPGGFANDPVTKLPPPADVATAAIGYRAHGINVDYIEGVNEYNHWIVWLPNQPPAEWPTYLRTYTQGLKQAIDAQQSLNSVGVVGPTIVEFNAPAQVGSLSPWVDFGNMHWYCAYWNEFPGENPPNLLPDCHYASYATPFLGMYPSKPFMITETGYISTPDPSAVPAEIQKYMLPYDIAGKYTVRRFFHTFRQGAVRTYYYELGDIGRLEPTNRARYIGLMDTNLNPKPGYTLLKNVISLLADPGSAPAERSLALNVEGNSSVQKELFQKRDGSYWLVLWNETKSTTNTDTSASVKVVTGPRMTASSYRPWDGTSVQQNFSAGTEFNVTVPDHPIMLKLVEAPNSPPGGGGGGTTSGGGGTQSGGAKSTAKPGTVATANPAAEGMPAQTENNPAPAGTPTDSDGVVVPSVGTVDDVSSTFWQDIVTSMRSLNREGITTIAIIANTLLCAALAWWIIRRQHHYQYFPQHHHWHH